MSTHSPGRHVALDGVTFRYDGGEPVLADVDLHLSTGWHAVVGPNGAGKSTLLGLLGGQLEPSRGQRRGVTDGYICRQRVDTMDEDVPAMAWAWDKTAGRLRSRLRLDPDAIERWSTLSPGERKRWQIGAALWREPSLLLLDEPTNHLDVEARTLLLEALADFEGIGVVVSHDRAFMEAIAPRTIWVATGGVEVYDAPYATARQLRASARQRRVDDHQRLRRDRKRAARQLADARRRHDRADASRSSSKDHRDHDARSAAAKARRDKAAAVMARRLEVQRDRLARAERAERTHAMTKERGGAIRYEGSLAPKAHLLTVDGESFRAGQVTVLEDVRLSLGRTDRIHLRGPNGAGKSTLLRQLAARITPSERVAYLPQELPARDIDHLLHTLRTAPPDRAGTWLQRAATLGADPDKLLRTARPSPGEARKLWLAKHLVDEVFCLLLDEPTNHFDVETIERIEGALADFPGALVLVTHDETLAARCTEGAWEVDQGRLSTQPSP